MKLTRWYSERSWCPVLPPHKPSQESHWTPSPPNHLEKLASSVKANDSARYLIYEQNIFVKSTWWILPVERARSSSGSSRTSSLQYKLFSYTSTLATMLNMWGFICWRGRTWGGEDWFWQLWEQWSGGIRMGKDKRFPNQCIFVRIIPLHPIAVLQSVHLRKSRCQRNSEVWFEYKLHFFA